MGKAFETIIVFVLIGIFVVGGGAFIYFYMTGGLDEIPEEELYENETEALGEGAQINDTNNSAQASTIVDGLSWKKKTIKKLFEFMGFDTGDDAALESQGLFYATKNIVLFVIFVFGSILLAISAVIYISKMNQNKGDSF